MHTLRREGAVPSLATDLPGRVSPAFSNFGNAGSVLRGTKAARWLGSQPRDSQSLPACWVPPCSGALKILQVQPARRPGGLVGRGHVEIFYKSSMLVDREVWSVLVKCLQVQLPGRPGSLVLSLKILQVQPACRPGSLVWTCEIFTSPTTWSTGKSPSERSLLSLLLAAWPAGAGEVGAAHFFWSFLRLSLRLTALGSRPDLAGRPGVLAGGRLQPVRPERPVDDMT